MYIPQDHTQYDSINALLLKKDIVQLYGIYG